MKKIFTLAPSLSSISGDLILRNMIFCVLYITGILVFFNYMLWPTILRFKSQYVLERREQIIYNEIKRGYDISIDRLSSFEKDNASIFTKINNPDAFEIVQQTVSNYLSIQEVQQVAKTIQQAEQTQSTTYMFKTQTQNMQKLWELMNALQDLDVSLVINPPVQIQKASLQSGVYDILFGLELRHNIYEPTPLMQEILRTQIHKTNP